MGPKKPGRYSLYKLSPEAKKIKSLLDRPEVVEQLLDSLIKSTLLHKFLKLVSKCALYMIKNGNEKLLLRGFYIINLNKRNESEEIISQVEFLKKKLALIDNTELDVKAEYLAKYLVSNMNSYINRLALLSGVSQV